MTIEEAAADLKSCIIDAGVEVSVVCRCGHPEQHYIAVDTLSCPKNLELKEYCGYEVSWIDWFNIDSLRRARMESGSEVNI